MTKFDIALGFKVKTTYTYCRINRYIDLNSSETAKEIFGCEWTIRHIRSTFFY